MTKGAGATVALGLCLRLAQIDDGDAVKFEGEPEFLKEMVTYFMRSDPDGTRELAQRLTSGDLVKISKPVAHTVTGDRRVATSPTEPSTALQTARTSCLRCDDTGWVRSIPSNPASARMTCKCRQRRSSTVDGA